ncbi:hypothetical protein LXA43DRAFT_1135923 [Ganoderma leucocontextum]|nr:hypothetical protein LXA43DRAFT_1135923 [Ganoderma leucocontextum]
MASADDLSTGKDCNGAEIDCVSYLAFLTSNYLKSRIAIIGGGLILLLLILQFKGDESKICDAYSELSQSAADMPSKTEEETRPEIDRAVLRKIFLGAHELTFANRRTTVCNVFVGADGAHSRARPLVSPAALEYTTMTGAEISLAPEVMRRANIEGSRALVEHGALLATTTTRCSGSG